MRTFVYGLQSSGASLIAFFIAQRPQTYAVVDLYNGERCPTVDVGEGYDLVLKCTVHPHPEVSLARQLARFRPDRTILVLRHPAHNYASLVEKRYARALRAKFRALEALFVTRAQFDLVVHLEDFVLHPERTVAEMQAAGLPVEPSHLAFPRTRADIEQLNFAHPVLRETAARGYGNVHYAEGRTALSPGALFRAVDPAIAAEARRLCPTLSALYEARGRWSAP